MWPRLSNANNIEPMLRLLGTHYMLHCILTSFSFLVFSHFASFISSFGLIIAIQFKMWPNTITLSAHKHTKRHIYVLEKKIVHTYNICRIKLDNIIRIVWKDRFYSDNIKILRRIHVHSNTHTDKLCFLSLTIFPKKHRCILTS